MSKFEDVHNWLKTCPYLMNLWAISATMGEMQEVLFLNSTTELYANVTTNYKDGRIRVTMEPTPDYSETYTINAYKPIIENANEFNIDAFNQAQQACDWILEQQNNFQLFEINGETVYAVELLTPSPIEVGVNEDSKLVQYYISIRVHMKNPAKRVDYFV